MRRSPVQHRRVMTDQDHARIRAARVWIRTHKCRLCGVRWMSRTLYPTVCAACSLKLAKATTLASPRKQGVAPDGRRYEERQCADCGAPWRIRTDAKSKWCSTCRHKHSGAAARARFAAGRAAKTVDRNCENCGRVFQLLKCRIPPWNKTTASKGRFCSVECRAEWQRTWLWDRAGKRQAAPKHRRGEGWRA